MEYSRLFCDMSPSIATTLNLAFCKSLETFLVRIFVEQNTITCPLFSFMKSVRYLCLSLSLITKNDWSIPSPLKSSESIRIFFGLFRYLSESRRISGGIVAENIDVILFAGTFSNTYSISSIKPMSNMTSASSNTTCLISSVRIEPWFKWSINLPGVATTISGFLLNASNWTPIPCPP